jgi:iron complex outermembrane receptor protein
VKRIKPLILLLGAMSACAGAYAAESPGAPLQLNIAAQPIDDALREFGRQSGLQIFLASAEGKDVRVAAVVGAFTVDEGLERLLANTGLRYEYIDERTVAIRPLQSSSGGPQRTGGNLRLASAEPSGAVPVEPQEELVANVLQEVTVTGSRVGQTVSDVPTSISIVSEKDLADQFARGGNLFEALDGLVPGIVSASREKRATGCVTMRGRNPSIQLNGIPLDQTLRRGTCTAAFQISPFALERVEVVRGATALYGSGSPGGIINMRTRQASSAAPEIDAVAQFGVNSSRASDTGALNTFVGLGQKRDRWDYYVGLGYENSDAGRTPDGEYVLATERESAVSFNSSVGVDLGDAGSLRFTGTYFREKLGQEYVYDSNLGTAIPVTPHPDADGFVDRTFTLGVSYERDAFLGQKLLLAAYHQDQTLGLRNNFYDANFGGDFFLSQLTEQTHTGFRSTLAKVFELSRSEVNVEYGFDYSTQFYYNPMLDNFDSSIVRAHFGPDVTQDTRAFFVQAGVHFGRWRLTGGARHETYTGETGDEDVGKVFDFGVPPVPGDWKRDDLVLANVGFTFDLSDRMQIYGGFSQGAEIAQLSRAARGDQNPEALTAEAAPSDQYELGVRGSRGPVELSLAAFYSHSDKSSEVQGDPTCAGLPVCPLIPLRVEKRIDGIEATVDWKVNDRLAMGVVYTDQEGEIYEPSLGEFVAFSADIVSPRRTVGYVEFSPLERWNNRLQMTHNSAMNVFTTVQQGLGYVNTESTFLTHLSSSYGIGPGEITLSVANLFDEEFVSPRLQTWGGGWNYAVDEGRRVTVGYRARF